MAKSRFFRLVAGLLALTALSFALTKTANASPQPDFQCQVQPHPLLQGDGYVLGENIYFMGDDRVGLVGYADLPEQLPRIVSGSVNSFPTERLPLAQRAMKAFWNSVTGQSFPAGP